MKLLTLLKAFVGCMALMFGAIGLFLPVWPTTPFVLLAVGCFSATPRIRARILRIKFFNDYYEAYAHGQRLRKATAAVSIAFLWAMLLLSVVVADRLFMAILLPIIGVAVTVHILMITRARAEVKKDVNEN